MSHIANRMVIPTFSIENFNFELLKLKVWVIRNMLDRFDITARKDFQQKPFTEPFSLKGLQQAFNLKA